MAKYKKRADGRYSTSFVIGYSDDGRPKRKMLYGRTITELDKKIADFKSLQNRGIVIYDEKLTIGEWSRRWLELYKHDKSYNTYKAYSLAINNHIIPNIGNLRLNTVKTHHLQELLNQLVQEGKLPTADFVKITLKQIIQQAICEEYIYKDITTGLTLPKKKKTQKRALTAAEIKLIGAAELTETERMYIDILYYTGLRKGEALALTKGDIDLINNKLTVNKHVIFKENTAVIQPSAKTKAGNRIIPIPAKLHKELKEYLLKLDTLYLFTNKRGETMTHSDALVLWNRIINKLNIAAGGEKCINKKRIRLIADDITPHLFRHTYATNLYKAGVDIKTAQYLLGHASIQMTMDIYTHLDNEKVTAAADVLNNYFGT